MEKSSLTPLPPRGAPGVSWPCFRLSGLLAEEISRDWRVDISIPSRPAKCSYQIVICKCITECIAKQKDEVDTLLTLVKPLSDIPRSS